jgi:hypothetical protein
MCESKKRPQRKGNWGRSIHGCCAASNRSLAANSALPRSLQQRHLNYRVHYRTDKLGPLSFFYSEAMDKRKAQELRDKAKRYRSLARQSGDEETANRIFKLAAELEQQAHDMERDK